MTTEIKNVTLEVLDILKNGNQLKKEVFYSFLIEIDPDFNPDKLQLDSFETKCNNGEIIIKSSLVNKEFDKNSIETLYNICHIAYLDAFEMLPQLNIEGRPLSIEEKLKNSLFNKFDIKSWHKFYKSFSYHTRLNEDFPIFLTITKLNKPPKSNAEILTIDDIYNKINDTNYVLK
jgi:hypothetical protein